MTDVTCEDRNLTVCEVGDMLGKGKSSVQKILSNIQLFYGAYICVQHRTARLHIKMFPFYWNNPRIQNSIVQPKNLKIKQFTLLVSYFWAYLTSNQRKE